MDLGRAPDRLDADLGQPDVAHVARLHEIGDRTDRVLDRNLRIEPRRPVDVDVVDAEPGQAVCEGVLGRGRPGVVAEERAVGAALRPVLHADDRLVAPAAERLPDQQLVLAHAVEVAGIEDAHPAIERSVDRRDALGVVARAVPAAGAHAHAAQGDREHLGARSPELDLAWVRHARTVGARHARRQWCGDRPRPAIDGGAAATHSQASR